jgi:hypothetical protein
MKIAATLIFSYNLHMGNKIADYSQTAGDIEKIVSIVEPTYKHESNKTNRSSLAALEAEISA